MAVRTFRPARSWPASIAGAVVLVVAVAAAVEVIFALAGSSLRVMPYQQAADYAEVARWSDLPVRIASGVLALIGVVLISLALVPGRGRWFALRTDDPHLVVGLSRPGLRRMLSAAACQVEGVHSARVRLGGRTVAVHARTELRDREAVAGRVRAAVQRRIDELQPLEEIRLRAYVRYAKA